MKTLKGNGPENTTFKGAINPGSNLAIESAAIGDVNVYGGTLSIAGGVVLNGRATMSGTAAVEFTGGTIGASGNCHGMAFVSSAVLAAGHAISSGVNERLVGLDAATVDMNKQRIYVPTGGIFQASGVTFSGGSGTTTGVFRVSGGTASFYGCSFLNCSTTAHGVMYQQVNTGRMTFVSCTFSGLWSTSNTAVMYRANNGYTGFSSCVITGATARTYSLLYYANGGSFHASNCVFSSNVLTNSNGVLANNVGSSSVYESCVFVNNSCTHATHAGRALGLNGATSLIDCFVGHIVSSPFATIYTSATCNLSIRGGTYSEIQNTGTTTLDGVVSLGYISSGTVNIASGASIALTNNISCTAINVADGGCTVNGAVVSAGTYTNIDSTGTAT